MGVAAPMVLAISLGLSTVTKHLMGGQLSFFIVELSSHVLPILFTGLFFRCVSLPVLWCKYSQWV